MCDACWLRTHQAPQPCQPQTRQTTTHPDHKPTNLTRLQTRQTTNLTQAAPHPGRAPKPRTHQAAETHPTAELSRGHRTACPVPVHHFHHGTREVPPEVPCGHTVQCWLRIYDCSSPVAGGSSVVSAAGVS